ncbi:MAG: hypothetical protein JO056_05960 [Alphaproteobacteria bacterium]|jgi:hypothetical protein|uniref:hypothetical protein n=1 Tax=Bradyrhizobium sp. TaxID=376 RepID=UPI001ED72321|nr:hypothetical protein [Bradyrhizobium sp.]MBV9570767.1 hypothetical protein [Alphaproteobacteria bacterium]MBV9979019.1 hypothetical protein [Bradyrhizobium sp.]
MRENILSGRCRSALLAAAAIILAVPLGTGTAMATKEKVRNGVVVAGVKAPHNAAGGWQAYDLYSVPVGNNLLFTYTCPSSASTPVGNSFNPTGPAKPGLQLVASLRPSTKKDSWTWEIHWPSGAPANSKINFNIYCVP